MLVASAAYAQGSSTDARLRRSAFPAGTIEGRVLDDRQSPVSGAMVSVVGRTTAAATTDRSGRYTLRELPYGPYILSVHSRGFYRLRGRTVQLVAGKVAVPEIQLARARKESDAGEPAAVAVQATQVTQLAGFGVEADTPEPALPMPKGETTEAVSEDGETAWRVRHLPRSILKDVDSADVVGR